MEFVSSRVVRSEIESETCTEVYQGEVISYMPKRSELHREPLWWADLGMYLAVFGFTVASTAVELGNATAVLVV